MIQLKPHIDHTQNCPHCGTVLVVREPLWQGIHVCVTADCPGCRAELVCDLAIGQARYTPYCVDLNRNHLFGDEAQRHWFGEPLQRSLQNPCHDDVELNIERFSPVNSAIILNCIDFLYGHALLKLLNAEALMAEHPELGLIVIVPHFLRWLVPNGVAEIWSVELPLARAQQYYTKLNQRITNECGRFAQLYLSHADSHPARFAISTFSGVARHDCTARRYRITFIWREDRPWCVRRLWVRIAKRVPAVKKMLLMAQNKKVTQLFTALRKAFPEATLTVAGFGRSTSFPSWVEDHRVMEFDEATERGLCKVYAESRLVIGVHGSNMLLPSAHAGMIIDLMPDDRWPNLAQDILYQEDDVRMASYRYRYLPLGVKLPTLALVAARQITALAWFRNAMTGVHRD